MGSLSAILNHPDDFIPLLKLKIASKRAEKHIPPKPHWAFCYTMSHKVSRSFGLVIQQLRHELRDAVCIFYLVLRALDTVEDDTSIPTDVKVPILIAFHQHVYDCDWHFACGTNHYKVLMDEFHQVSTAFLEIGRGYQKAIEDITMRMGAGMAKFICKEVETIDDYDEYCHYVAGLVGLGLSKLFHAANLEELASDGLSNSMGLFLQKTNIIWDYLEDINEIPKSRMFWPREIWSKYVDKLEVDKNDPNASNTLSRIEAIQKVCRDSGTLNRRRSYIVDGSKSKSGLIFILFAAFFVGHVCLCFSQPQHKFLDCLECNCSSFQDCSLSKCKHVIAVNMFRIKETGIQDDLKVETVKMCLRFNSNELISGRLGFGVGLKRSRPEVVKDPD